MVQVKKKKTQEEEARTKRVQEGNEFIQKREQATSKAAASGNVSVKAARKQASQGITRDLEAKSARGEQITVEESRQATEERRAAFQRGLDIATSTPEAPAGEQQQQVREPNAFRDLLTGEDFQRFAEEKGGTSIQGTLPIGMGGTGTGALKALFSRKLALRAAANKGISKKVLSTGTGAVGGFFGLKALLSNPSKRIESIKTSTTTMGETIAGFQTGLDVGLDPVTVLENTAELRRQLDLKEENLKLMMIHSAQQQVNPEKSQDATEEINKIRNKIFLAEQKALQKLATGSGEFDPEEYEAWLEDSTFEFPKQLIPKEKGEVPFKPLAKEGVEFETV